MATRKKATKKRATKKKVAKKTAVKAAPKSAALRSPDSGEFNDLPPEVRKELRAESTSGTTEHVIDMVHPEVPTSINQIIAGLWREHRAVVKRGTVQGKLVQLRKRGEIRRCGRGAYVKT